MSGIPYTDVEYKNGLSVGAFNNKQYRAYNRFDIRIAKGFSVKGRTKMHLYLEVWNAFNSPNMFKMDKKTLNVKARGFDLPTTAIFLGLDWDF